MGEEASSKITQVGRIPFLESVALTPVFSQVVSQGSLSDTRWFQRPGPVQRSSEELPPIQFLSLSKSLGLPRSALTGTYPPRQSSYFRVDWLVNLITSAKSLCCITQPNPEIPLDSEGHLRILLPRRCRCVCISAPSSPPAAFFLWFLMSLPWGQLGGRGEEHGEEVIRAVKRFLIEHNFYKLASHFLCLAVVSSQPFPH